MYQNNNTDFIFIYEKERSTGVNRLKKYNILKIIIEKQIVQ
jgi:hypothetical protein